MTKTHEIKKPLEKFNEIIESDYLVLEQNQDRKIEKSDFVLFIATNNEVETGQTFMTQVQFVKVNQEGLKEGYVLIKYKDVK
ncbi:DUF3850 domain-containing protein [Amedibacillus sp. YH-ame6]